MKKLCLLLALVLAISAMPALAAQGDIVLGRDEENRIYFNYAFPAGDTVYLSPGGPVLYSYHVGDADYAEHTITVPETEGNLSYELFPFADGEDLYAIALLTRYGDSSSQFEGAKVYRLIPDGDGFSMEENGDLDWDDLVEYYDTDSYPVRPEGMLGLGGKALFRAYDQSGDYFLYAADVTGGAVEQLSELKGIYNMTPYKDNTLLVELYDYTSPSEVRLLVYDPADESTQNLTALSITEYNPLSALAYDAATDTLYCAQAGEVHVVDLEAGEVGEGVTDMPIETYGRGSAFVMEGGYYVYGSEGMAVRNLDPGQRAEIRFKINDSDWSESVTNAYYAFTNARGDVSVVLSREWTEAQNLLENMMNRDDSIDVYVMNTSSSIYDALYKRGYLMELDGSEKLMALADRMYPQIREQVSADGHLVALPIDFYAFGFGVNVKVLETLGMSLDDVPDNWMDFLEWIKSLEGPLSEHENIHLFYAGYNAREAKNDLFNSVFEAYQQYVNTVNPDLGYNSLLLKALLGRLEEIDFVALGCPEAPEEGDEESEGGVMYDAYSEDSILLQSNVGCCFGGYTPSNVVPILMGLDADTPMPLVLRTTVAFVNPYTQHPDVALAFMETLSEHLTMAASYSLDPTLNEPVRGAQNEQNLADAKEMLENAQKQLEEADEADRQMLEENLRYMQENVDYWENDGWEVSQKTLDWYRGHDDNLALERVNWLYTDDTGEAWNLIMQYMDGAIGIDEMLSGIDRKAQMMRLEGN